MELLLVVGGVGLVHLLLDLLATRFHSHLIAFGNNRGGVFVDGHAAGSAQHLQLGVFKLQTLVFRNQLAVGQHRHVFDHRFATITETRSLHCSHIEYAAQAVHHQGGKSFFLNVLSDDQERLTSASNLLKDRYQVLYQADLLIS